MGEEPSSKRERLATGSSVESGRPPHKRLELATYVPRSLTGRSSPSATHAGGPTNHPGHVLLDQEIILSPVETNADRTEDDFSRSLKEFAFVWDADMRFDIESSVKTFSSQQSSDAHTANSASRQSTGSLSDDLDDLEISGPGYVADRLAYFLRLGVEEYPNSQDGLELISELNPPSYRLEINGGKAFEPQRLDVTGHRLPDKTCIMLDHMAYAILSLVHAHRIDEAARTVEEGQITEPVARVSGSRLDHFFKHGPKAALTEGLSHLRLSLDKILQIGGPPQHQVTREGDTKVEDHVINRETKRDNVSRLRTVFGWRDNCPTWKIYTMSPGDTEDSLDRAYNAQ